MSALPRAGVQKSGPQDDRLHPDPARAIAKIHRECRATETHPAHYGLALLLFPIRARENCRKKTRVPRR